ncbi:multidrug effflux MFS transporter [Pseudonocardia sp. S2-4]|uniref:Multidrug effflux MFS transporter n=2 Tax=Pseudonocardia humida TaxID=2800819 RepID=A0ABT1ADP1_9PSEU|nr:multidrug effflux MFS transporter [Pseudonocardia humida]
MVLALGGLSSFGPLAHDLYLPALPAMAADLATTEAATQLTLSACMIGMALGQLLVGPFTDRVGRRRPLIAGVALFAVTAGLCALAPSIELLLVLRLLSGLAGGAGIVIARAMVRDLYEGAAAARVFALLVTVTGVAPVLAPLLGGQLLRVTDWRGVFWALAVIGLVLLVAALTRAESLPVQRRRAGGLRATGQVVGRLLRDRSFVVPALVQGLGVCGMFVYIAMGTFVLQGVYGLDAQAFSLVFAANSLALILLGQLSAALVSRLGSRRLLGAGVGLALAAAVAMLVGVLVSDSVWALLPPLLVLVGCSGLILPNGTALALAEQGEVAGTASALVGLTQFGLAAAVPPLASLGGVSPVVMAVTTVGTAAAAVAVFVVGRPGRVSAR